MEIFGGILGTILVAILISALFYYAFNARGPWGSFWSFFLVLLLIIWAASLWVRPIGPVYWGVAWIPLFFVGLLFALLLAAIPTSDTRDIIREDEIAEAERERQVNPTEAERRRDINRTAATVSGTFWILMVILLLVIIIGYMV